MRLHALKGIVLGLLICSACSVTDAVRQLRLSADGGVLADKHAMKDSTLSTTVSGLMKRLLSASGTETHHVHRSLKQYSAAYNPYLYGTYADGYSDGFAVGSAYGGNAYSGLNSYSYLSSLSSPYGQVYTPWSSLLAPYYSFNIGTGGNYAPSGWRRPPYGFGGPDNSN